MTTRLRDMRWWDIEQAASVERQLFGETAWTPAQFWAELARANRDYVVCEDAEGIAGYAGLMTVPPTADIQTIAVAPRAQGRGLARTMLDHLLVRADDSGCTEALLEVAADNGTAIALYERSGFEAMARRTSYYGPGRDALVMRRRRGSAE